MVRRWQARWVFSRASHPKQPIDSSPSAPTPFLAALAPEHLPRWRVTGYALRLRGIRVQGRVGVSDAERAAPQELVVAVDVELGGTSYPATDDLERAANYAEIVSAVAETADALADRLLETYALRVAERLVLRWPAAHRVRVAVTKAAVPVAPHTDEANVEVTLDSPWS
ncbi:MAG TPA: dihydroneopterin aldolase [Polyangiaceae bacterium]